MVTFVHLSSPIVTDRYGWLPVVTDRYASLLTELKKVRMCESPENRMALRVRHSLASSGRKNLRHIRFSNGHKRSATMRIDQ
jgi:hypothetical protein